MHYRLRHLFHCRLPHILDLSGAATVIYTFYSMLMGTVSALIATVIYLKNRTVKDRTGKERGVGFFVYL